MTIFEKKIDLRKLKLKDLEEFFDKLEIDDEGFKNRILLSFAEILEKENTKLKDQLANQPMKMNEQTIKSFEKKKIAY